MRKCVSTVQSNGNAHDVIIIEQVIRRFTFSDAKLFTKTPFTINKRQITPVFCVRS